MITVEEGRPSRSHQFLGVLFAGLLSGIVTLTYSISYAALIFSGDLEQYLPHGIAIALISAVLVAVVVALGSSFPFALAGPDSNASALLALMASAIVVNLQSTQEAERILPTVWAAIVLATLSTGGLLFVFGRFHLGRWIRFFPYPVVWGFLAGTGLLVTRGAFQVMAGVPLGFAQLHHLIGSEVVCSWLPGLGFALLLLWVLHRWQHYLILPGMLVGAVALVHVFVWMGSTTLSQSTAHHWFFDPFSYDQIWKEVHYSSLLRADWSAVARQSGTMAAMLFVVVLTILFNATGVELETDSNGDLDRELQANGIANMVTGLFGGMVGYLSLSRSLLNYKAGARNGLAGVVASIICAIVFFFGASFLSYLPKVVLGGLLLYIGLSLLIQWGHDTWFVLSKAEYAIIILIATVIGTIGFCEGIGVGVAVAAVHFIISYSRVGVTKNVQSGVDRRSNVVRPSHQDRFLRKKGEQTYVLELHNYIFFGTAHSLVSQIRKRVDTPHKEPLRFVVLDFRLVSGLDSSAVLSFIKLRQMALSRRLHLIFTSLEPATRQALQRGGCLNSDDNFVQVFPDIDRGLEWCENKIVEMQVLDRSSRLSRAGRLGIHEFLTDAGQVIQFMDYLEPRQVPEDYVLFRQGDPSDGLYFLENGQLSILLRLKDGSTRRVGTHHDGTIIGEMGLYGNKPRMASAVADQSSSLYYLSLEAFKRMERETPLLAMAFHRFTVNLLASRLRHAHKQIDEAFIRRPDDQDRRV